jgi:hypothetical protein
MRFRHAAALALVGWYLMLPPWVKYNTFDASEPLSKWDHSASYDSAAECERVRSAMTDYYSHHPKADDADWFLRLNATAQCVATDDPRLKGE